MVCRKNLDALRLIPPKAHDAPDLFVWHLSSYQCSLVMGNVSAPPLNGLTQNLQAFVAYITMTLVSCATFFMIVIFSAFSAAATKLKY